MVFQDRQIISDFKTKDRLYSTGLDVRNDATDFLSKIQDPPKYLDDLKEIIFMNHFSPLMNQKYTKEDWRKIYRGIVQLCLIDSNFAFTVSNVCGPFALVNSIIVEALLLHKDINEHQIKKVFDSGFYLQSVNCGICMFLQL